MPNPTRGLAIVVSAAGLVLACAASAAMVPPVPGLAVTSSRGSLVISSLSGRDRRALTKPRGGGERRSDYLPTWSPDGSKVAFARWTPNQLYLMVVRSDGSGLRRVAALGRRRPEDWKSIEDIRWSRDGAKLAYLALVPTGRYLTDAIFVAGVDGSGERRIARLAKEAYGFFTLFGWTADGTRITYSYSEGEPALIHYEGPSTLVTTAADGTDTRKVVTEISIDQAYWLQDGRLLYVRKCFDPGAPYACQLALLDPANGQVQPLTRFKPANPNYGWDYLPFFRGRGDEVVFTHGRKIYELSTATNTIHTIRVLRCPRRTCRPGQYFVDLAGITPDGRYALIGYDGYYIRRRDYRLDLETGALTRTHLVTVDPAETSLR